MMIFDSAPISGARRTKDGYMVADVRVARAGVQTYRGSEIGIADRDTVRVYRPAEEVFSEESLHSYAHRPVTLGHPAGNIVDASNWKRLSRGQTGETVVRDGNFVRVPIVLMDGEAISAVETGLAKELSMGLEAEINLEDGVTPDGEPYDAVVRNLRMNHLAVVPKARGGSDLRIGDTKKEDITMTEPVIKTRTVLVDGLQVETTDQGAAAIEKLVGQAAGVQKQLSDAQSVHSAVVASKDAEIDKLTKAQLSDADIQARVIARATLVDHAKLIAPQIDVGDKSDADLRREAVRVAVGDAAIAGKDDTYVQVRFDIAVDDAQKKGGDPLRKAIGDAAAQPVVVGDAADVAYKAHLDSLSTAWQTKQ